MPNTASTDLEKSSSQAWNITDAAQTGLDFGAAFTLATWVKFESFPGAGEIWVVLSKWNTTGNQRSFQFGYRQDGGSQGLFFALSGDGSGNQNDLISWTPSTGVWYHIALVYNGSLSGANRVKYYIDGSGSNPAASPWAASTFNSTAAFEIGGTQVPTTQYFDGLVNDVRVWSRALTDGEISSLYSTPCSFDNGANLQGWWFINSLNSTTDAIDNGPNGNDLNNVGSPTFSADVAYMCAVVESGRAGRYMSLLGVGQ